MSLRIAVTGTNGQVATALADRAAAHAVTVVPVGRPALDLTDPASIRPALEAARPDVVVNAAAYTAVDKAETEQHEAFAVNASGAGQVAQAARDLGVPIIHISTDYVYDGSKTTPYVESDPVAPLGVYGASKLAGEQAVAAANPRHVILRTAWVYSPTGRNFIKTMLALAASRPEISVVADQTGCPTAAADIADAVLEVAKRLAQGDVADLTGVFHLCGTGEATWAGLAETTFALSAARGGPSARVKPIATAEYPTPARRPANSRLDCGKLARDYGIRTPHWRESLARCIEVLLRPAGT